MNVESQSSNGMPSGPKKLLTAREICNLFGLSKSFVYQHTMEGAKHPLLGRSRPDIVMRHYAHVLDENADKAADLISGKLGYKIPAEFPVNPVEV